MLRMAFVMWTLAQAGNPDVKTIEDSSAAALTRGDYQRVLALTEQGLAIEPNDAWLLYDRGAALSSVGRLEESVATLKRAEAAFTADQLWGRALSSYRRALVLSQLGRCAEAQLA